MPDPAPPTEPTDAKPRVISAAIRPAPDEPGVRPLPWPPWAGRHGSVRATAAVVALWCLCVVLAAAAANLGARDATAAPLPSTILGSVALHLPWTLAVLWLLYGGLGYGLALLLVCCASAVTSQRAAHPWFSEPLALVVFAGLQHGFPFSTSLRGLPSAGLFAFAAFCGAVAFSMAGTITGDRDTLAFWEPFWFAHFAQDLVVTAPLAFLLGAYLEGRKRAAFGSLPPARSTLRHQALALLLGLASLIAFCVSWVLAADRVVDLAIKRHVMDPYARAGLEEAHHATASRKAALVALLLGAVCSGAALIITLLRRYREELRAEVRRNTEAFRRRHTQLAGLQQVTESVNRSLDPDAVYAEVAQSMARLTDAAQATVYVPDLRDTNSLRLVKEICRRPERFDHRRKLAIDGSITGQCFRRGSIVTVPNNLPVYIDAENVRAQFQQHKLESLLAVPITGERGILGVVSLTFDRAYAPDEEEHRLFRLIGRAVGAALERAEVHLQARRYAGDLGGLYRFSQQLAGESDEAQLLSLAAGAARRLLGAQAAAVFMASGDGASDRLRCVVCDGVPEKAALAGRTVFRPHDTGLLAEAVREVRTVGVGIRSLAGPQLLAGGWEERSVLAVPLPIVPDTSAGGALPRAVDQVLERADATPVAAGALVLIFEGHEAIGLERVGLAEELVRQTAAGLRRARLITQTRQQAAELRLLEQIGRSLGQRLSMSHVLEQTVQNVSKIAPLKLAAIYVLDQASQMMHVRACNLQLTDLPSFSLRVAAPSLVGTCLREGRALLVPDAQGDPRCNQEMAQRLGARAAACIPLGPAAQRFGVLLVARPEPGEFERDEVRRLEQVAQLASAAIERARVYEDACQRADELILLNEVGHLLVESPALEGTLLRIAELVCRNFQLAGAGFFVLDEAKSGLASRGVFGAHSPKVKQLHIPLGTNDVTTQAFRQNQALVVEQAAADKRVHRMLLKLLPGAVSGAVIPMAGAGGPAGVFGVWNDRPHVFQPRELQCLGGVARLAAAAVGRGQLVQALQASENRLQEVVDGIHALIVSLDTQGNILSFNATAERMTGLKQAEVLGRSLAGVAGLSAAERAKLEGAIARAFATLDCSEQLMLNWASREGGERKIRWRSSFLRGADGRVTGMVCLGVDITEQTLLEAQLLQAQKMESVGALAGGMAHDFNNLLGGIIGQCALGRAQTKDERTLASLAAIEAAAQRGADLTSKLMAFARKSVLQPRAVDIGALIQETTALLAGSLPRTIEVASHVAPALPPVHGDPTQLQQVLLNLCVNARDAMPQGGRLTISAMPAPAPVTGAMSTAPGVIVEVADTGTGMTQEVQEHLFEPFFTTKTPGKGTGLGLSVVFGIVRSHGGQITYETQLGKGTRFTVRLPRARPPSGKPEARGGQAATPAARSSQVMAALPFAGQEKVLLVDDDAILRETVRQLLQNLGYTVRTAAGGVEALQLLDASPAFAPAVVLLDVVMPGLAGLQLFKEVRRRVPAAPVVVMSGYSADQAVISLLEAGARELIQKPFTLETLASAIRRAVAHEERAKGGASARL